MFPPHGTLHLLPRARPDTGAGWPGSLRDEGSLGMRCDKLSHMLSVMQLPHRTSDWAPDPKVEEEGRQEEHARTYLAGICPPRWPVSANEQDPR